MLLRLFLFATIWYTLSKYQVNGIAYDLITAVPTGWALNTIGACREHMCTVYMHIYMNLLVLEFVGYKFRQIVYLSSDIKSGSTSSIVKRI